LPRMTPDPGGWPARVLRSMPLAIALLGCASNPVPYNALFNQPDGLGPGDIVQHGGTTIGSVSTITPGAGGAAQITVQVDHEHASSVHADSILILHGAGTSPSLELMTPNPLSAGAADGATLYGASNEDQADMLAEILGPESIGNHYSQIINRYAGPQLSPAPGSSALQNQLMGILQHALSAATSVSNTTPTGRAQMDQFRDDAGAVVAQLDAHGRTTEAAQLRAQIAALPQPPTPPNTLSVPSAVPNP